MDKKGLEKYRKVGEKATINFHCRFSKTQYERLQFLAEQNGHKTISNYIRTQCLSPNTEHKINEILDLLKRGAENGKFK